MSTTETVEIFKTDVPDREAAKAIVTDLLALFPGCSINFDLDDCDRILRVKGDNFCPASVISFLRDRGFYSEILE